MEFEFTDCVWIDDSYLNEMIERAKNGETFSDVYSEITMRWEDEVYYISDLIKDQIERYVMSKVKEG